MPQNQHWWIEEWSKGRYEGSYVILRGPNRRDADVWRGGVPTHDEAVRRVRFLQIQLGGRIYGEKKERNCPFCGGTDRPGHNCN